MQVLVQVGLFVPGVKRARLFGETNGPRFFEVSLGVLRFLFLPWQITGLIREIRDSAVDYSGYIANREVEIQAKREAWWARVQLEADGRVREQVRELEGANERYRTRNVELQEHINDLESTTTELSRLLAKRAA